MKEKPSQTKDGEEKDKEDSLGSLIKSLNIYFTRTCVSVHLTLFRLDYILFGYMLKWGFIK